MWFESFWNFENTGNNEQKESLNYDLNSLNDTQEQIESEASNYVLMEQQNWREITQTIIELNWLIENQRSENESLESLVQSETKEELDKEALINEAKITIYEILWINDNIEFNSSFENFTKWFVDELVI